MAGIVYDLIEILEEEKECYDGLNTLANYTEHAVVNKNIEFLQEVVKTEEEFVGRLGYLAKKRDESMSDIAIVTGMKKETLTVSQIIEKLGKDTEVGMKLTKLRDEIKEAVEGIKRKTELNKQLLTDSLELVDFMVNAIGSTKGYAHVGNYSKPGEGDVGMNIQRQQSIFDTKQ